MSTSSPLPVLDQCVDLYMAIWRQYGDDAFTVNSLLNDLEGRRHGIDLATVDVSRELDLLIAYGLLDREDDESYRIRCYPDRDVHFWQEKQKARVEQLYEAVQAARNEGEASDANETEFDRYQGERYAQITFDDVDDVADFVTLADKSLSSDGRPTGVVVRAPGTEAGDVQDFADRVCNVDIRADHPGTFEKTGSVVRGNDVDNLEFRMYLRLHRDEQ
ncbi:hypothetical protein [Halomicrococcus sp. NG-SE-24]|uniref:hypothetical protein n=1 Tax=Halomicrococcus sp. NG-SE-24 TaxID=3436928 RepID=UPI003D962D2C